MRSHFKGVHPCAIPSTLPLTVFFKAILGSEENLSLLIHFLNAVLGDELTAPITHVHLLNPYNAREFINAKESIVDVKARDESGRVYQVEIQIGDHPGLKERILHNWSEIYHSQIKKGDDYELLKPVYSIWILGCSLFQVGTHLTFEAYDRRHDQLLSDNLRIHLLQLRRLPRSVTIDDEVTRWMMFFKKGSQLDPDDLPEWMGTEEMKQAMATLEAFAEEENYELYRRQLTRRRVDTTLRNSLRRKRETIERLEAAMEKAQVEKEQAQAETERAQAEKEQAQAETEKAQVEKERAQAEKEQAQAETEKAQVEKERAQAEKEQAQAETEKAQVEKERAQAEKERAQAEKEQAQAETARERTEKEKAQARAQHVLFESERILAEKEHIEKEYERLRALLQQNGG